MTMSGLLTEKRGSTLFLTLDRPEKKNALDDALIGSLKHALRESEGDEELRAAVIRGAGTDFCSGADLSSLRKISESGYEENLADASSLAELFSVIRSASIPVIAAVHGRALAGGCGLATGCDIVLAAEGAVFGYPEVHIGFVPAIVSAILRRNVSEKVAFELLTRGERFSCEEAARLGLVNRILPSASFEADVEEFAAGYGKVSHSAVALTKRLLYSIDGMGFDEALAAGAEVNAEARMTEDCKRGIAKFLDK